MAKEKIYVKGNDSSLVNLNNQFVYEVCIFCRTKKYFSLSNRTYYVSDKELAIVKTFQYNSVTLHRTYLHSAPLRWLLDNDFILYTPPIKKPVVKSITEQNVKSKTKTNKRNYRKLVS